MSNRFILLKVHLAGITGFNKLRYSQNKSEKRKTGLVLVLYAFVSLLIIAFVSMYAVLFAQIGLAEYIIPISFALSSVITLVFSLLRGAHILFAVKDYDMLVSLPVKKSDIVISRLVTSYLVNIAFCALVMLPCITVAFIFGTFGFDRLVYALVALAVCPLIPVVIADVIGTLILALTMNMRHKAVLQTIFSALAVLGIMAISFLLSYAMNGGAVNIQAQTVEKILLTYPPAWLLMQSMAGKGFFWVIILVAASFAVATAFVAVLAKFYLKINSRLISHSSSGKFSQKSLKSNSVFFAMYKNEFARLVSSPPYMLNSTVGLLLLTIISVASIFVNPFRLIAEVPELGSIVNELKYMVCIVVAYMLGLTIPTASSLSLEGSRRWITFSVPVPAFKILAAKILISLTLSGTTGLVCALIMTFSLELSAVQAALLFATVICVSLFSALFGMLMNVKFPKYDWTSEAAVIKRGAASTIAVLAGIFPPMILFMLGFVVPVPTAFLIAGIDALYLIISVICLICLTKIKLCDK